MQNWIPLKKWGRGRVRGRDTERDSDRKRQAQVESQSQRQTLTDSKTRYGGTHTVIPVLERLRQQNHISKVSLGVCSKALFQNIYN